MGGSLAVILVYGLAPLLIFLAQEMLDDLGILSDDAPAIVEDNVMAARFVQLGEILDPNKLPNRKVPRLTTAPPDQIAVSQNPQDHEVPDAGPPPDNATEDLLQRLGDRAQMFAEIAEEQVREGSPDGIEDGTETEAQAGDLYRGQIYRIFKSGWTVPTTLSDDEKKSLSVDVTVDVGDDLKVKSFRLRGTSGNSLFDQSVLNQVQSVQQAGTALPEPPTDAVRATFIDSPFSLRFRGSQAN